MRVLLSGGKKTYNIIDGIRKKFTTSGDDFVVIEYLDDIMDMFARGDYFDKYNDLDGVVFGMLGI